MNKKISFLGVFLLLVAVFASATVTLDSVTEDVNPGETVNGQFTLINNDSTTYSGVTFELAIPGMIEENVVFNPETISPFNDGQEEIIEFSFDVPNHQSADSYTGTITIFGDAVEIDTFDFNFDVNEKRLFDLSSYEETISVDQGESESIVLDIENEGNVIYDLVTLTFDSDDPFEDDGGNQIEVTFDQSDFVLNPGQTKQVTITVTPEEDQYLGYLKEDIKVTAKAGDIEDTKNFELTIDTTSDIVEVELDDDDLDDELEPGETFHFEIDVENIADYDLEDIVVKVWVIDIDSGDDLSEKASKFDLDQGDVDDVRFEFQVPLSVDEEEFDIKVRVEGEDKDDSSNTFKVTKIFRNQVDVVKDNSYEVYFDDIDLSSTDLRCGSQFMVSFDLINIGDNNLDDMYIKLFINELNLEYTSETFDLDYNDDDDRDRSLQFNVKLPSTLDKDSYEMKFYAYDEDDDQFDVETYTITVTPCQGIEEYEEDEEVVVTPNQDNQNVVFLPTGWAGLGLNQDTWTTIFWILGDIVLVLVALYFLVLLFKKRR